MRNRGLRDFRSSGESVLDHIGCSMTAVIRDSAPLQQGLTAAGAATSAPVPSANDLDDAMEGGADASGTPMEGQSVSVTRT